MKQNAENFSTNIYPARVMQDHKNHHQMNVQLKIENYAG